MIAQYTQAAMVAENRRLAVPASVDTLPTSAMQEDHVSLGWAACRKLRVAVANLARILAVELVAATWGLELRRPAAPPAGGTGAAAGGRAALGPTVARPGPRPSSAHVAPPAERRPTAAASSDGGSDRRRPVEETVWAHLEPDRSDGAMQRAHSDRSDEGARPVPRPAGTELTCRGWPQEAAMRMLQNNLDPEVAERPDDLVVYGGTGRAARSWAAFDAIVATLRTLADDETLLVQSGKPVGVFRTHEWAPRVLIANSNLVPDWADWDEFRRLEAAGLTMYGQMTAGSWIYIGTQGILQGTYECFAEIARRRFGGSLAGTITLTAGLGGMGGAQPLAITMNDGVALCIDVDRDRVRRRLETRYLDELADDLDDAVARCVDGPRRAPARCRSASSATPPTWCPGCSSSASRPTSSPTRRAPTTR